MVALEVQEVNVSNCSITITRLVFIVESYSRSHVCLTEKWKLSQGYDGLHRVHIQAGSCSNLVKSPCWVELNSGIWDLRAAVLRFHIVAQQNRLEWNVFMQLWFVIILVKIVSKICVASQIWNRGNVYRRSIQVMVPHTVTQVVVHFLPFIRWFDLYAWYVQYSSTVIKKTTTFSFSQVLRAASNVCYWFNHHGSDLFFFSLRHFGHVLMRHFGHLSHSSIRTCSIH